MVTIHYKYEKKDKVFVLSVSLKILMPPPQNWPLRAAIKWTMNVIFNLILPMAAIGDYAK